jgi:hypothetical protein
MLRASGQEVRQNVTRTSLSARNRLVAASERGGTGIRESLRTNDAKTARRLRDKRLAQINTETYLASKQLHPQELTSNDLIERSQPERFNLRAKQKSFCRER